MNFDISSKSWSACSDEIHTPEGVKLLNEFYSVVDPLWHVELVNGKAVLFTGGQPVEL